MTDIIRVTRHDRVAVLELYRPDAMNAVDIAMRRDLHDTLDQLARDVEVRALVLTGAGKAFSAGADLKSAAANPDTSLRRTARTLLHDFQPILEIISRMDKPIIAAVNGAAVGVGMSLVLACDLVVMAEDAYLMAPFVNIGLIPDGGLAWFLTQRIGYARAFELLAECDKINAPRCLALGLANRVTALSELQNQALEWATRLSSKAPLALALTKRVARLSATMALSEALTVEAEFQTFLAASEDTREALSAFAEKRPPTFRGR